MADKSPYVLVSVFKEDAKEQDVVQAAGKIATIIEKNIPIKIPIQGVKPYSTKRKELVYPPIPKKTT